jgi:hypothetical protein
MCLSVCVCALFVQNVIVRRVSVKCQRSTGIYEITTLSVRFNGYKSLFSSLVTGVILFITFGMDVSPICGPVRHREAVPEVSDLVSSALLVDEVTAR